LQLPWRSPVLDGSDLAGVRNDPAVHIPRQTIDTVVALGGIEAENRVVEDVECLHAELAIHLLLYLEVLQQREIRKKLIGSGECISSHVAKLAESWTAERAAGRTGCGQRP